tara:strand:+ start:512 stop:1255 length:744 start_codon:yes stop_codon:yes gene_type:complete
MNAWLALYIKELKDNRGLFLFLLGVPLLLNLYTLNYLMTTGAFSFNLIFAFSPLASLVVLPFVLTHSFSQEAKTQTNYLLLSLPVSRTAIVLSKFAAVLSTGIVLYAIATGTVHLIYRTLTPLLAANLGVQLPPAQGWNIWLFSAAGWFTFLLLFLGLASAMAGVRLSVRRFRGLASFAAFIFGLYLYARLMAPVFRTLSSLVASPAELANAAGGADYSLLLLAYSALAGAAFLGAGIWLFDRFAKA